MLHPSSVEDTALTAITLRNGSRGHVDATGHPNLSSVGGPVWPKNRSQKPPVPVGRVDVTATRDKPERRVRRCCNSVLLPRAWPQSNGESEAVNGAGGLRLVEQASRKVHKSVVTGGAQARRM
ncbi:glycosyltransferase [Anopheles sinensis]|uniref:Glycosyltransferase n=1 Tax=Anopheles sinensis TaxID=74873 RepID=A0A084VZN4_ANOSI|nr:glycosyltransferase [Anopheles sinensis]